MFLILTIFSSEGGILKYLQVLKKSVFFGSDTMVTTFFLKLNVLFV